MSWDKKLGNESNHDTPTSGKKPSAAAKTLGIPKKNPRTSGPGSSSDSKSQDKTGTPLKYEVSLVMSISKEQKDNIDSFKDEEMQAMLQTALKLQMRTKK